MDYFLRQMSSLIRFVVVLTWQSERPEWTVASHQRSEAGNLSAAVSTEVSLCLFFLHVD